MKTVLVVDDMPENVVLVRRILGLAGFRVEEALSGEEALNAARREMPDLVLLDLRLGEAGMSGYEAVRRLRDLPGAEKAVLVALSGGAVIDDEEKAREAGFHGFIQKPFDLQSLTDAVTNFLSRGAGQVEGAQQP